MSKTRKYSEEDFREALKKIKKKKLTPGKAAKMYSIPKSTLQRYVNESSDDLLKRGRQFTLYPDEEETFEWYITWMAEHNQPITYDVLERLATDILKKRNPDDDKTVSRSWCKRFLKRHNLSQKMSRPFERSRICSASVPFKIIEEYFEILANVFNPTIPAAQIYSMDEVGWSTQQELLRPVLKVNREQTEANVKQVFSKNNITSVHTISGSGKWTPPHIIYSRDITTTLNSDSLPLAWTGSINASGNMDSDTFESWFHLSFLKQIGSKRPVVLILNPASFHLSLDVLEKAIDENIAIVNIPVKTSHILQPVEQIVSRLKKSFGNVARKSSDVKAGFLTRPLQFPILLKSALEKAWTEPIVQQAFLKTGVVPLDLKAIDGSKLQTKNSKECFKMTVGKLETEEHKESNSSDEIVSEESPVSDIPTPCSRCGALCPCLNSTQIEKHHQQTQT